MCPLLSIHTFLFPPFCPPAIHPPWWVSYSSKECLFTQFKNQQCLIPLEWGLPIWPNITSFLSYHSDAYSLSPSDYTDFFPTYVFSLPAVPFALTSSLSNVVIGRNVPGKPCWNLNEKPLTETSFSGFFLLPSEVKWVGGKGMEANPHQGNCF